MKKIFNTIKEFWWGIMKGVTEVVEESRTFCAQEQPCVPPSAKPCTSNSQADAMAQMQDQLYSESVCSCLALQIVKLMRDFPKHLNIEAYTETVAVPLADLGNGCFAVKFYKTDAAVELKASQFSVELKPELNRRAEMVRLSAVQEINKATDLYYATLAKLNNSYPQGGSAYCNQLADAYIEYCNVKSCNEQLLINLNFTNMCDYGTYVVVKFSACYDCRGVTWVQSWY